MSVEAMTIVLNHPDGLSDAEFRVLIGVANHAGSGGAWPSIAKLAQYAEKSERQVQRIIAALVGRGRLAVELHGGGNRFDRNDRRPNRYTLLMRCPPECDGTQDHAPREPAPGAPDSDDRRGDTQMSPRSDERGDTQATPREDERGDAQVSPRSGSNGLRGDTQMSPEPKDLLIQDLTPPTPPPLSVSPAATGGEMREAIRSVFDAWRESTGKRSAVLDGKRIALIAKRLRDYPVGDLCDAVRGWQNSPHHRGENDRQTVYNSLDLLLRDAEHVERFRDLQRGERGPELTGMARIRAMTNAPPAAPQRFGQIIDVAAS